MKTKTLNVKIDAMVEIDYSDADLQAYGKTFREFKAGVEHLVRTQLLPALQNDPNTRIQLMTLGFPSNRKLKMKKMSKTEKQVAKIMAGVYDTANGETANDRRDRAEDPTEDHAPETSSPEGKS